MSRRLSGCGSAAPGARKALLLPAAFAGLLLLPPGAEAQAPFRKIGELELSLLGISASLQPESPIIPKNIPSGVRIVVRSGGVELPASAVEQLLRGPFQVHGELSGPGLPQTITLPVPEAPVTDPLLLPFPGLSVAGDYRLTNTRIVVNGQTALGVSPEDALVRIIDQVLVTSVKTRALTLDEIRERGIVLDSDAYLGFEFTLGLSLESNPVVLSFPVVFDRRGVPVPQPLLPPMAPPRQGLQLKLPTLVPMMLEHVSGPGDDDPSDDAPLTMPDGTPVRIPGLLVIPGDVGYLKQHFGAQLFVANGAPGGSGLVLREVTGKIALPPGPDGLPDTDDDPLTLPDTANGPQPDTLPVGGLGPDGEPGTADDDLVLSPGEQGQAEFTVRGETEGFHPIAFDIEAVLEGLPTGPVTIHGKARGGVLVRNPYFDMTFTVPSVVRADEEFDMFVTVTNVGQGTGNLVSVAIDELALSGAELLSDPSDLIETLPPGDSHTVQYRFRSLLTGEVVASYLRFDTQGGPTPSGKLNFTLGVGERGVALSPDTLVLPSSTQDLPPDVVRAAMRVLGQAWSVAQAPTLPAGVLPISGAVVKQKALAFSEAGLRKRLGQPEAAALRDLVFDFHGGDPRDDGFDQLLRATQAGRNLDVALGRALAPSVGTPTVYERETAEVASSGPDFISFAVGTAGSLNADVVLRDAAGNVTRSGASPLAGVPGAGLVPLSVLADPAFLGLATAPLSAGYTLEVLAGPGGESFSLSVTLPRADGTFAHGTASQVALSAGGRVRLALSPGANADALTLEIDGDGDGVYEGTQPLQVVTLDSEGPRLVAAAVIGPETLSGASPFGYFGAMLFDRVVDGASAGDVSNYQVPKNRVEFAKRQLSGRIVFMALEQPEGEYVPTTLGAERIADLRGKVGPTATVPLTSELLDPGAVVTGQVIRADGMPLFGVTVTYSNNKNFSCLGFVNTGVAAVPTDAMGFFEFRYVRQDQCGYPFRLDARDPQSGAVRNVTGSVRVAGELIHLDIAFLGYGSVTGAVRKLDGSVAQGASVRVVSVTDPQVGGVATTDVAGVYLVPGITVGPVVVDAALGTLLGHASGNIPTAGATALVDVVLDGVSNVSGTVYRLEGTTSTPVPGLQVLYYAGVTLTGVDETDAQGQFEFLGMPAGSFLIKATLPTGEHGQATGSVVPGQTLPGQNVVIEVQPDEELGTLRGVVLNADLTPAAGAVVNVGAEGAFTAADGSYEITRVPVVPFQYQTVFARSASGLAFGSAQFQVNAPGQVVEGVEIRLSGLGSVEFLVLDPAGQPVPNQVVRLGGFCGNPCGCNPKTTGANGKVLYDNLPLGNVSAQAVRVLPQYTDVAQGAVSITQTTTPAQGLLQFKGVGTVQGTVLLPGTGTDPAHGANVALTSLRYVNDGIQVCGMVPTASTTATDQEGHFQFTPVSVGPLQVKASSFLFPTPVGAQGSLTANGQTVSFTLRLVDTIAGELSGRVFLPDGTTPAGANVEVAVVGPVPEVKVKTDAGGYYHFAPILPQGTYVATVRDLATGGVVEERLYLPAGQPTLHDFRLKSRGPVSVRVVEANNSPAESAFVRLVELEYPRRVFEGVADASNGSVVTFPGIYEGPITAEAFDVHGQGGRSSGTRPPGTDPVEVKVTLGATGTVVGHFLMPDGAPIPYGAVKLIAGGQVVAQTTTAGSGDVGSYFFDYVPAGLVRLEAQDPLTARTGFAVGSLGLDETLTLDVHAQALGRVLGVVTSNGAPAGGAGVTVKSGYYQASTSTDGLGAYVIEGVPEGMVEATASYAGGFLKGSASGLLATEGQSLTLDVALHDSGEVQGLVLQAGGSDPAPLSLVKVQVAGWSQSVISGPDGSFHFAQVPTGLATLTADVLGSIDVGRATAEVPAGGSVHADVVLNGIGALAGEIVASGNPIAGKLTLTGTGPFPWAKVLYIPANGQFALPEVLAGPFTAQLVANIGGFTLYGSGAGVVVPGQTTTLVVSVQDSGRVIGHVLRSDGTTPAYGANVTVKVTPGGASVTVPADPLGGFEAIGVPLGTVEVRVTDPATGGVALATGLSLPADGATADAGTLVLDDTPVAVVSVDPADGSIGIATSRPVYVTFSDPLASTSGLSVKKGAANVGILATLSSDGLVVTLTPAGAWPDSSDLDVVASTSVTDVFGRHLAQAFTSRFTTVDLSAPVVTAVSPANQAIQVPPSANVVVTFSEPLSNTSPFATLVQVAGPAGAVAGSTLLTAPAAVTFTPAQPLPIDATYTVTVNGAIDLSGNQQTQAFTSSFKTLDTIAPVLSLSSPGNGLWVKVPRPSITVLTNDGAGSGIDTATDSMLLDGAAVTVTAGAGAMTHSPAADLAQGQHSVAASAADRAGNLGTLSGVGFGVDTVPPEAAQVLGVSEGQVLSGSVTLGGLAVDPGAGAGTGSGVSRIDLLRDTVLFLSLFPPFSQSYNTTGLPEGPHAITARATDMAGNVGPSGPAVNVVVDNVPVVVTITAPPAGAAFRDLVPVAATASQVIERMEFRVGAGPVVADTTAPYQAVLDVTAVPEGPATLTVAAFGFGGETAAATRGIVVDRTAPATPDAARIRAEDSGDDTALVLGQSGSVESGAKVEITNLDRGVTVTVTAAADGSFAGHVEGALGNTLSLVAVDAAGNRSGAVLVVVEEGNASGQVPITGLRMWVMADAGVERDASNVVSAWRDQQPNGPANDLSQAVAAARPLYVENAVGGNRPTIRFDGTSDYLQFTTRLTNVRTVFWVISETPGTPPGSHLLLGDSLLFDFLAGSTSIWSASASPAVRDGQLSIDSQGVDGLLVPRPQVMSVVSLVTNASASADSFSRDRGQAIYWKGDLSELLIYDRPLSGAERKKVEDYLALKYALYLPQAAAPSISPDGGHFSGSTTVTLSTTTPGAEIHYTLDGSEPGTASPLYSDPLAISESLTLKARAFRDPYPESETSVASFLRDGDLSPLSFTGLRLWLRGDAGVVADSSGRVSVWRDQSGNGADAQQPVSSRQPIRNPGLFGGLPALELDGQDDYISFPRLTTIRTVFWVIRQDPAASSVSHQLLGDTSTLDFFAGATTIWSGSSSAFIRGGQTRLNGTPVNGLVTPRPTAATVVSLVTTGNVTADNLSRDRNQNSGYWWGDLAELVIYDRALTPAQVQSVEDYLTLKYRPYAPAAGSPSFSPNGGSFTGSVEVTLESTTAGAEIRYTNDLTEPTDTSTLYEGPITLTDTTTLKAKAFRSDLEPSVTAVATFERSDLFTPRSLSGLQLWVRPDAGLPTEGSHAALWLDQSGLGNHLVQAQGDRQPAIVPDAGNGWPALRFDGNDFMSFTNRLTTIRTVFWVIRQDLAASSVNHQLLGDTSTLDFFAGATTIWSGSSSAFIRTGQTWISGNPIDGLQTPRPTALSVVSLVTTGNVTADNFSRDRNQESGFWWGDLAELVIYDRPLTGPEHHDVEEYLRLKYRVVPDQRAAIPGVTPNGGSFTGDATVSLSTTTPGAEVRFTTDGSEPDDNSESYQEPFLITNTTTVKAKAFRADLQPSQTAAVTLFAAGAFVPSDVPNLALWARADAGIERDGDRISVWRDQSGLGNDLVHADAGLSLPSWAPSVAGGLPGVHFDGQGEYLRFTSRLTTMRSLFWVIRQDAAASSVNHQLLGDTSTLDFFAGATTIWSGSTSIFIRNGETRLNGAVINGTVTPRPTTMSVISVVTTGNVIADNFSRDRNQNSGYWWGDAAEVLIYDRALTAAEASQVRQYLGSRYGIAVQP